MSHALSPRALEKGRVRSRPGRMRARPCALAVLAALAIPAASARAASIELRAQMKDAGFSDAEVARAEAGNVVTRILPQRDDTAAFVIGVARIAAPPRTYVDGIRAIETFRRGGRLLQIGRFSTPPSIEDLQALAFENQDFESLRTCKLGDCDIQVDRQTWERSQHVNWKAADAKARAAELLKESVVEQVKAYLRDGAPAMAVYIVSEPPTSTAAAFEQILRASPDVLRRDPDFYRYLLGFPNPPPPLHPNVENYIYWSKEDLLKPVVSAVHVCLETLAEGGETRHLIAMKHIYDSHFFFGYAEFITVLPEPGPAKGFYVVHSIRARVDPPQSFRGFLLGKIKRGMRTALGDDLLRTKRRLEALP